ncbi:immunoglobulin lambda-1 light chain-like isoform X3 [Scyliorhinus canicula]|uniref:immunoglobulin lambda-1 light chain-like isoform X3 n=1 Tax=Scyliorhinus canicula TaxID=7830 RepID=UPI0018F3872C|nr:immunoglobulin lambda-1 light chain-like isoform X3 [Scyliorhinus canicula]
MGSCCHSLVQIHSLKEAASSLAAMMRMLCFFCSLALWLGYGQSQTLTQPPDLTVTPGNTATLVCNTGIRDSNTVGWYKQTPGAAPQWVLSLYYTWDNPGYGTGFSSNRFASSVNSDHSIYQLIIKNVEVNDAAVYYCGTWVSSSSTYVFGQGTKLFVAARQLPDPSVKLLGPSADEISTKGAGTLVCLVSKLSMGFAAVSWTVDGSPTSSDVQTSVASRNSDNSFSLSSYLTVPGTDWSSGKVYSCTVQQGAASKTTATASQSGC